MGGQDGPSVWVGNIPHNVSKIIILLLAKLRLEKGVKLEGMSKLLELRKFDTVTLWQW